tara:strand:- start:9 stop:812 length:804 start_codon:yes stop_codon:yes gene_type:complete
MLMRDIRMAGFKYFAGTDQILKYAEDTTRGGVCPDPGILLTKTSYLKIEDSNDPLKHHNPLVIRKNTQGPGTDTTGGPNDICCDQIQISYEDFNQNDYGEGEQVYKRYRITYYATTSPTSPDSYAVFKRVEYYNQPRQGCDIFALPPDVGWITTCPQCTREDVLVRDHVEDMEFIPIDQDGRVIKDSSGNYPAPEKPGIRDRLYDIRGVDIKLTFRSKEFFFNESSTGANQKIITGLSERNLQTNDRYLRDSVIVTVGTRNIGGQAF